MIVAGPARAASRLALVLGNSAYPGAALPTSANDAGLVAVTLAQAGFDVTALANTTGETLGKVAQAFAAEAKVAGPDTTIVVYLAGRGLQVDGENFFVPIDAKITRSADVATQAMRLSDLTKAIDATGAKTRVFVYDLARSNVFAQTDGMPLAGGLALVAAPKGALYAFNAAPGAVAPADLAPYGAYARALCEMIQTPGLSLAVLFERVRLRVGELNDGAAVPWDDAATDDASLAPTPASVASASPVGQARIETLGVGEGYSVVVARDTLAGYLEFLRTFPRDPLSPRVALIAAVRREALFWAAAARADDARAFWTYMRRYPRGAHYYDARRRLAALSAPLEPPPRFDIETFPDLPPPSREEAAAIDRPDLSFDDPDWDTIPAPPASLLPSANPSFYEDLPPPPLTDPLALPLPAPVPIKTAGPPPTFGRITQPAAADRGEMWSDTTMSNAGSTTTTKAGSTQVSRIVATPEQGGRRAIVQTGLDQVPLSQTTILHDATGSTVVQTGAGGGVLSKSVTLREADDSRATLIRDGANRILTDVRRNRAGITIWANDPAAPPIARHPLPRIPIAPAPSIVRPSVAQALAAPAPPRVASAPPPVASAPPAPARAAPAPPLGTPPVVLPPPASATPPMPDASKRGAPASLAALPAGPAALPARPALAGVSLPPIGPVPPARPKNAPRKAKAKTAAAAIHRPRKH